VCSCIQELRAQIDEINDWVYNDVNNGVYKCGFSTTQVLVLVLVQVIGYQY